jgi:hypothetical protein
MYKKLGDNISTRILAYTGLANAATATLEHDIKAPFAEYRYDLYLLTGSDPWSLTRVTSSTSPSLSQFTIVANGTNPTTHIDVTNNSGASRDFALVLIMDPLYLKEGDIKDVDITTTAPEDGQALVYDSVSSKFKPGASGDSSFKLASIATSTLTLKGGYLPLSDGREIGTYDGSGTTESDYGTDIAVNLTTILGASPANATTYYLYIDLDSIGSAVTLTDSGRKLYGIAASDTSKLSLSTTTPDLINRARYRVLGLIRSATTGNAWTGTGATFKTWSTKLHDNSPLAISPVVYTDEDHSIGTVGSAGQLATYGIQVAGDFPGSASLSSFYTLDTDGTDASGNAKTFTAGGSPTFLDVGLFGKEKVYKGSSSSSRMSRTGDTDFNINLASGAISFGGWFKSETDSFGTSASSKYLMYLGLTTGACGIQVGGTDVRFTNQSGSITAGTPKAAIGGGWHFFAAVISAGSVSFYVDGQLAATNSGLTGQQTTGDFFIGNDNGLASGFLGSINHVFISRQALTESQINTLYSKRFKKAQLAGGHVLSSDSFPLNSLLNKVSFFPLTSTSSASDGSVNAKNLTSGSASSNTAIGISGASDAVRFTAGQSFFLTGDSYYSPKNIFGVGGWVARDRWSSGSEDVIFFLGDLANNRYAYLSLRDDFIYFYVMVGGTSAEARAYVSTTLVNGSFHHFAATLEGRAIKLYIDGILVAQAAHTTDWLQPSTNHSFYIGKHPSSALFAGRMQHCFFIKDYALTDYDVRKIYSARLDLSGLLPGSTNQQWLADILSEDGLQTYDLNGESFVVDKSPTGKVWVDFGGQSTSDVADRVTLRCKDLGLTAAVVPSTVPFDNTYTSNPTFPITHGLPEVPQLVVMAKNASSEWVTLDSEGIVKATSTQILGDLSNLFTLGYTSVRVKGIVGNSATGVKLAGTANDGLLGAQQYEAFTSIKTSNYTAVRGDKVKTNTTSAGFTITMPASPQAGDKVEVFDSYGTWSTNNITIASTLIEGVIQTYTFDVSGASVTLEYVDATQGWRIF